MNYLIHAGLTNAVLALLPALLAVVGRRWRADARLVRALWLLALVKLLTPPVIGLPVGWAGAPPANSAVTHAAEIPPLPPPTELTVVMTEVPADEPAPPPLAETSQSQSPRQDAAPVPKTVVPSAPRASWEETVAVLWCVGAAVVLAFGIHQIIRFQRFARWAAHGPAELTPMTRRIGTTLGLRRTPKVVLLEGRLSPVLWGLGPQILLPRDLWESLSLGQREALLAHELAHYGRGDHYVRWIEFAAQVLYWWHPLVWVGARQMRVAEEEATDAVVVKALPDHAADYARALLAVVDLVAGTRWRAPVGASGMSEFTDLSRRMQMIMEPRQRKMNWLGWAALSAGGLALAPVLPVAGQAAGTPLPAPAVRLADAVPGTAIPMAEPAPGETPQQQEAVKKLLDEGKQMEEERKRIDEFRKQLDDTRRNLENAQRQIAAANQTRVPDEREIKLRELELQEFKDTGKEIITARLEADVRLQLARIKQDSAKANRLHDAGSKGLVSQEEAEAMDGDLETAKAEANIAQMTLLSWQKYGIIKRQMELEQRLEAAKHGETTGRTDAASFPGRPATPGTK